MNLQSTHQPKPVSLAPLSILGTKPKLLQGEPATANNTGKSKTEAAPHTLIVGLDDRGKAHASWFPEAISDAARQAAERMCMHAIEVDASTQAIAARLPAGKLFESGLAFVPFVKREVFEQLMAGIPADEQGRI